MDRWLAPTGQKWNGRAQVNLNPGSESWQLLWDQKHKRGDSESCTEVAKAMLGEIMEALEALEAGELLLRVGDRAQLESKFKCEKHRKEDSPYICPAVNMPTPYQPWPRSPKPAFQQCEAEETRVGLPGWPSG